MNFIPVNEPLLKGNEKNYLIECIDSGWLSSEGPFVQRFEEAFAARVGKKYGVAVTNGTAAIDVAIEVLGIGPGDEVIVPAFTIISCLHQIVRNGAKPVLVDSDPSTWNMDVSQVEGKITPQTKAILVPHIYGLPVDLDPIKKLCKIHGMKLIEDAAEMIGHSYKGRPCGSYGDISTVSFYSNKHITTGEGGMILTDDEGFANQCRELRNLCFTPSKRFVHERLGWNLRMTNMQAAVGVAQLEQLDRFLIKKRWIGERYNHLLADLPGLQLPLKSTPYATNIYWVYGIILDDSIPFGAEEAIKRLNDLGVGSRPFFCPMNLQPVFQNIGFFQNESYPIAERMYQRGFYLPSGLALTEDQIVHVSETLKKIFR